MENMVIIAEDIIEQRQRSHKFQKNLPGRGQAATTFKTVDDPLGFIDRILGQETKPSRGGICSAIYTMQDNSKRSNEMYCNAMHCNVMQCSAFQINAMQRNATQCNATQCNAMKCNVM